MVYDGVIPLGKGKARSSNLRSGTIKHPLKILKNKRKTRIKPREFSRVFPLPVVG